MDSPNIVNDPIDWDSTKPHPFHGPLEDIPRNLDGTIPLYYYLTPEEIVLTRLPPPPERKQPEGRLDLATQVRFIEALAETGTVSAACTAASVSRMTVYRQRNRPEAHAFRAAWEAASRAAVRVLADTAMERAVDGVEESVYYRGHHVGFRRRYSDRLLMFLLRARDPANYAPLSELGEWNQIRGIEPVPALDTALARLEAGENGEVPPPPCPRPTPLTRVTSVTSEPDPL